MDASDDLRSCIQLQRRQEVAAIFFDESVTRLLSLGLMFAQWRRRVVQLQRLRRFVSSRSQREERRSKQVVFTAILQAAIRARHQQFALSHLQQRVVHKHLHCWLAAMHTEAAIQMMLHARARRGRGTFFRRMKRLLKARRKAQKKQQSQDALVTCCLALRAFNSWKRLWREANHAVSVLEDVAQVAEAVEWFLRKRFSLWVSQERRHRAALEPAVRRVEATRRRKLLLFVLSQWSSLRRARDHWRSGALLRALHMLASAASTVSAAKTAMLQSASTRNRRLAKGFWLALRDQTARRQRLQQQARWVAARQERLAAKSHLDRWSAAMRTQTDYFLKSADALATYLFSLQRRHFLAWADYVACSRRLLLEEMAASVAPAVPRSLRAPRAVDRCALSDIESDASSRAEDDWDECVEVLAAPARSPLLLAHYLRRLRSQVQRRRRLRETRAALSGRHQRRTKQLAVSGMARAWLSALRRRLRETASLAADDAELNHMYSPLLSSSPLLCSPRVTHRHESISGEVADVREWLSSLEEKLGDLSAAVASTQLALQDADEDSEATAISCKLLLQRRETLVDEIRRLKDESLAIMIMSAAESPDIDDAVGKYADPALEELREERWRLLRDIEQHYGGAVSLQSLCDEKADDALRSATIIMDRSLADKSLAAELHREISELEESKAVIERSLGDCQASLLDCEQSLRDRMKLLDVETTELAAEESRLLEEMQALEDEEALLREELEVLKGKGQSLFKVEEVARCGREVAELIEAGDIKQSARSLTAAVTGDSRKMQMRTTTYAAKLRSAQTSPSTSEASATDDEDEEMHKISQRIRMRLASI